MSTLITGQLVCEMVKILLPGEDPTPGQDLFTQGQPDYLLHLPHSHRPPHLNLHDVERGVQHFLQFNFLLKEDFALLLYP